MSEKKYERSKDTDREILFMACGALKSLDPNHPITARVENHLFGNQITFTIGEAVVKEVEAPKDA